MKETRDGMLMIATNKSGGVALGSLEQIFAKLH